MLQSLSLVDTLMATVVIHHNGLTPDTFLWHLHDDLSAFAVGTERNYSVGS